MKANAHKWIDPHRTPERSPAGRYIQSLGAGSRRSMEQSLTTLAALVAGEGADPYRFRWEKLQREQTVRMRAELIERLAPATVNKMLSALRSVLRTARDMQLIAERDYQTAASLEPAPRAAAADTSADLPITPQVIEKLFAACTRDDHAASRRDAAVLAIYLSTGLRRSEVVALNVTDYDNKAGTLFIAGERPEYQRTAKLGRAARQAIDHWLDIRSVEPGPLILPVDRSGLIQFRRLTDQAVYDILSRIVRRAGLTGVTSRALRRAYVLSLIRAGCKPDEVQQRVGHASWLTTAGYHRLARAGDESGYDIEHLPYRLPEGANHEPSRSHSHR